ncbi:MAG: hypothetical protein LBS00_10720 [Synergistaceae bacterium]|nr:hypothetical protein [Synergistaceae bacterium]
MKKFIRAFLGFLFLLLVFAALTGYDGATSSAAQEEDGYANVFEIREKMFIEQCNDIYLNPEDYLDRMIKLEGIYEEEQEGSVTSRYVIRYGPGCCGNDGLAGFEVIVDEALAVRAAPVQAAPVAQKGDWVEAIGSIQRLKDSDDLEYIVLKLSRLRVKEERGAEYVSN